MKNVIFYTLGILVFQTTVVFGQRAIKNGDKEFSNGNYYQAIEYYKSEKTLPLESERRFAEAYNQIGNYELASSMYSKIVNNSSCLAADYWSYGQILQKLGKYDQAFEQYMIYKKIQPSDSRVDEFLTLKDVITKANEQSKERVVVNNSLNTNEDEFSAVVYDDVLIFVSSKRGSSIALRESKKTKKGYMNIYESNIKTVTNKIKVRKFSVKGLNKKYHNGPIAFSSDGKELYVTRTVSQMFKFNKKEGRKLGIYTSKYDGSKWSKLQPLALNSDEYSIAHPAISADGQYLYFSSDMSGGKGGVDLYVCKREGITWGEPMNLESINTSGDEMFAAVHSDGLLSFSSNGHVGLGGLDIFVAQVSGFEIGKYINAGGSINSSVDDFGLYLNENNTIGYFSSNRANGIGGDDIYSLEMMSPFKFGNKVSGVIGDNLNQKVEGVLIEVFNSSNEKVSETKSSSDGKYSFDVPGEGTYTIELKNDNYYPKKTELTVSEKDENDLDLVIEKKLVVQLVSIIKDKKTGVVIPGVKVKISNNITGETENKETDVNGKAVKQVKEAHLNERVSYNYIIEKEGYMGKTLTYNTQFLREGEYNLSDSLNTTLEKIAIGVDIATAIDLNPINFDLGKSEIRKDAAIELDKVVEVLNKNPNMTIELGAHTDCRGKAAANKKLSQKRAESTANYLKKRVTSPNRVTAKGYGESMLLNSCGCEGKKTSTCSEQEHAKNRRTEFIVKKL